MHKKCFLFVSLTAFYISAYASTDNQADALLFNKAINGDAAALSSLTHIATRATPEDERESGVRRWRDEVEQHFGDSIPSLT